MIPSWIGLCVLDIHGLSNLGSNIDNPSVPNNTYNHIQLGVHYSVPFTEYQNRNPVRNLFESIRFLIITKIFSIINFKIKLN